MMSSVRRAVAIATLPLAGAVFVACSEGSPGMTESELEAELKDLIEQGGSTPPESVECDGGLPAEVGASTLCTRTMPDGSYGRGPITVAEIEGDEVKGLQFVYTSSEVVTPD